MTQHARLHVDAALADGERGVEPQQRLVVGREPEDVDAAAVGQRGDAGEREEHQTPVHRVQGTASLGEGVAAAQAWEVRPRRRALQASGERAGALPEQQALPLAVGLDRLQGRRRPSARRTACPVARPPPAGRPLRNLVPRRRARTGTMARVFRLVATDLDGTLLHSDGTVTERSRDVIRAVEEQGRRRRLRHRSADPLDGAALAARRRPRAGHLQQRRDRVRRAQPVGRRGPRHPP